MGKARTAHLRQTDHSRGSHGYAPTSREDVGLVHLPGIGQYEHETLCGYSLSGNKYEETADPISCTGCLRAAKQAREILDGWRRRTP